MFWINFLHIYQPPDQTDEILEKIVNESYRPLFRGFLEVSKKNLKFKINLNISGCLTELLAKNGYQDVINNIHQLAKQGNLEFTESAKYHALLPFLNENQIINQIKANYQTNHHFFGSVYQPKCFFPPEMAYSPKVGKIVSQLGYQFILLDEISFNKHLTEATSNGLFKIKGTNLIPIFRERRSSNTIMSGIIRTKKEFQELFSKDFDHDKYVCTAMDGETFGHHRIGLDKVLIKIVSFKKPPQIFLSETTKYFPIEKEINPISATWASAQDDINKKVQFYSWHNPKNKVHQLQWKLVNLLNEKVKKYSPIPTKTKDLINRALASDQFFWASGEPWWSIEMIEKGAWNVINAIKSIPKITQSEIQEAEDVYRHILSTAFLWQRSGKIGQLAKKYRENIKIPFKERTLENNKPEVYYAFINLMKRQMYQATKNHNFEKALLWRDAIYKLENKNDIYDTIHAVDLLRLEISDLKIRQLMDRYKEKYQKIASGQPESRRI
ncbi:MAG TPA: hypothetical protein ENL06_00510 [Candidatus Portnoybacteria bacterium]|nr:hypothetical protein [Candidatus Portnoybacteria bacterium]